MEVVWLVEVVVVYLLLTMIEIVHFVIMILV